MKMISINGTTPQRVMFSLLVFIGVVTLVPSAHAAPVYFDDFEDGNHTGWLYTSVPGSGGSGATGVELHNSSQMAFVNHRGNGQDSLSMDFSYLANDILSFDMHAVASLGYTYSGVPLHSSSGVVMTFLNFLNVPLGSVSLVNATNPGAPGSSSIAIDALQHDYSALMSDFAATAGLGAVDPIAKVSLEFFSTGAYSFGGNIYPNGYSSASVWFDNVTVGVVPVPAAVWLFASGFIGLMGVAGRRKI